MLRKKMIDGECGDLGGVLSCTEYAFPFPTDASKRLSITCAELSNVTFTNAPPFNVLGVPECGDAVRPQLVLYLPKNNARCESAKSKNISPTLCIIRCQLSIECS